MREKYGRSVHDTDDSITGRTLIPCQITKVTDTQSEYVILAAFPRQQWLRERAKCYEYTYIVCHIALWMLFI